jgi:hypothetical protein
LFPSSQPPARLPIKQLALGLLAQKIPSSTLRLAFVVHSLIFSRQLMSAPCKMSHLHDFLCILNWYQLVSMALFQNWYQFKLCRNCVDETFCKLQVLRGSLSSPWCLPPTLLWHQESPLPQPGVCSFSRITTLCILQKDWSFLLQILPSKVHFCMQSSEAGK